MRNLAALTVLLATSLAARGEIVVLRCQFADVGLFITIYDDGAPARIGTGPGVGSRATVMRDPRNGAWIVVEMNLDNLPITLTTIQPEMQAVHSRHVIELDGTVRVPSQMRGTCKRTPL